MKTDRDWGETRNVYPVLRAHTSPAWALYSLLKSDLGKKPTAFALSSSLHVWPKEWHVLIFPLKSTFLVSETKTFYSFTRGGLRIV